MGSAQTVSATNKGFTDNVGSLKLIVYKFDSVANTDTFTQKIPSMVGYWCNSSGAGSDVAYVAATGVFTFSMGATAACQLFVLQEN